MHSRALAELDPNVEPPDGSFQHAASGRSYRIYREAGKFRHEEIIKDADGKEIARVDAPIKYLIGSGNFCRSYLVEIDGFLHESPITWYTSTKKWGMSPGYDFAQHWSFERPIKVGCLNCHAGRVESVGGSVHKMALQEQAIGCERCHGPGSLHAAQHRPKKEIAGEDLTIVNPGKLPRPLLEAVCAECHLNGPASVALRGRGPTDFRPGRPLGDYRTDYRFDSGVEQMTVVGHIEQLRRSVCYQKSETLSCLTCHDPHARELPRDKTEFFRQKCLDCHAKQGCSVPIAERQQKQADNCSACHMPRGDTDIPHIAFTHHRIGRHGKQPAANPHRVPELVPTESVAHLSALDQRRNLGLAYYQASQSSEHESYTSAFSEKARTILEEVQAGGLREGAVSQALAEIYWKKDSARMRSHSEAALAAKDLDPDARAKSLLLLASCEFEEGNYKAAIARLEELTRLRRFAEDWRLMGISYLLDERPRDALPALQRALAIRPSRPDIHGGLFEVYRRLGDGRCAEDHLQKAQWLERHRQD